MADFMALKPSEFGKFIKTISSRARSVGVHLIMATQQLNRDNFTDTINEYMPVRICFKTTQNCSELCLGEKGAELLLPYGDMLYSEPGHPIKHIQCIQ